MVNQELEQLLSDICFSGFRNLAAAILQKIKRLQLQLERLGMVQGAEQLKQLIEQIGCYQRTEISAVELADCFCLLEFYQKNMDGFLKIDCFTSPVEKKFL